MASIVSTAGYAVDFADDFSADSITFSGGSFDNSSGIYSITPGSDGLDISVTGETTSGVGSAYILINDSGDRLGMDFTHTSSGNIESGYANSFLESYIYSDSANYLDTWEGSVEAEITVGYDSQQQLSAFHCLLREGPDGQTEIPGTCGQFEGLTLQFDQRYSYDIVLDREASTVTLSVGDTSKEFSVPTTIYPPHQTFKRVQLYHDNGNGTANGTLNGVRLENKTIDLATSPPVLDRYQTDFENGATAALVDEKLAVSAISDGEDERSRARLRLQSPTDYLEAEVTFSSTTELPATSNRVQAVIESVVFNTVSDGGTNGSEGDVEAYIDMSVRGDGRRQIEVCIYRFNDADRNDRVGLLNTEDGTEQCEYLPILVEFDTPYRLSMDLDRAASTFTFRANGISRTVDINHSIFNPSENYAVVYMSARDGAVVEGTIDNVRNSKSELTISEISEGLDTPTPFPEAPDPETLVAESTLTNPVPFRPVDGVEGYEMNFVDDFSTPSTTNFALWGGGEAQGQSGIYYDGSSLVLETNSVEDDGNWSELHVHDNSDFITAEMSLDGSSALPVHDDSRARLRIVLEIINDTQENGEDNTGDLSMNFGIEQRGDGRVQVSYYGERRGDASLDLSDMASFQALREESVLVDTVYRFTIAVDRENNLVRFQINDHTAEYPIQGNIYPAYRSRIMVTAQHEGPSGRTIGHLHTLETENLSYDFSSGVPAISPYRPQFNSQNTNRDVVWEDGRIKLVADGGGDEFRPARIAVRSKADYVSADLLISSESNIEPDGRIHAHVGSNLYNSIADGGFDENANGQVYGSVEIHATDSELYAAICAWRNDGETWTDIVSGDADLCLTRFDLTPRFDQTYTASVELDSDNSQIIYRLDDEVKVYSITSGIFETKDYWVQARANTYDESLAVVYVDNLTVNKNAPLITMSDDLLAVDLSGDDAGQSENQTGSEGETTDSTSDTSSGGGSFGFLSLLLLVIVRTQSIVVLIKRVQWNSVKVPDIAKVLVLGLVAATTYGCANTTEEVPSTVPTIPADYLDRDAVLSHVSGRTETWTKGGGYYASDGSIAAVWEGVSSGGSWRVTDAGEMCIKLDIWAPAEDCHTYQKEEEKVKLVFKGKSTYRQMYDGKQLDQL